MWSGDIQYSRNLANKYQKKNCVSKLYIILALLKFSKISSKLYNLLYWMSPDHILKLVGWPQARLSKLSRRGSVQSVDSVD